VELVANPVRVSETTAVRTLVKSAPELWAACSDAESLARHLGAFGEIQITRLEPETTVAWEGDRASGTVMLEQSGWGTKVTMTASTVQEQPIVEAPGQTFEETPSVEEAPARPPTLLARLLQRWRPKRAAAIGGPPANLADPPVLDAARDPVPEPERAPASSQQAVLDAALDSLGQAHHRPFSQR
jgi:hypothetical protein